MADFLILTTDVADGPAIRGRVRDAHLAWLREPSPVRVLSAGPWLDSEDVMRGSMLVVSAPDRGALDTWMADDPYAKAGLMAAVDVRPFKLVIGRPGDA